MSEADFDQVIAVHLKGAFACAKAAWPHFRGQKFGRIINTSSAAGIYGTSFSGGHSGVAILNVGCVTREFWSGELQCSEDGFDRIHQSACEGGCQV